MRRDLQRHFSKEDLSDGQQAQEILFNIISHEENANQSYPVLSLQVGRD